MTPEIIGSIAFAISLLGSLVYIKSIYAGKTKPHLYTWIVFTILTGIAFFAQLYDDAGPGAWTMGITAFSCFFITLLSLRYGSKISQNLINLH